MGQLPVECAVLRAIATAAVAQSGRYAWDHMGPFLAGKEADAEGPDNRDLSQKMNSTVQLHSFTYFAIRPLGPTAQPSPVAVNRTLL